MLDILRSNAGKPDGPDIQELREGLRKDLFAFLLEIEGIIEFATEKHEIRSNPKGLGKNQDNVTSNQTPRRVVSVV